MTKKLNYSVPIIVCFVLLLAYVHYIAGPAIATALSVTASAMAAMAIIAGSVFVFVFVKSRLDQHKAQALDTAQRQALAAAEATHKAQSLSLDLELKKIELLKAQRQAQLVTVKNNETSYLLDTNGIETITPLKHLPAPATPKATPTMAEAEVNAAPVIDDLLTYLEINQCFNVLVVGGKGSGKTTLLKHIASARLERSQVVVLDSHTHPAKWPQSVQLVGAGRDYEGLWAGLKALVGEMDKRYKQFSSGEVGERQHETLVSVIDEFTTLPRVFKKQGRDVQNVTVPILTEGRKVGIDTIWGIHSERVGAMGLEGAGDIRECFDAVIRLRKIGTERKATIDLGDGPKPCLLPAPKDVTDKPSILAATVGTDPAPLEIEPPKPSADDQKIIDAFIALRDDPETVFSWSKLTKSLGMGKGGKQKAMVLAVLERWQIDYSSVS